MHILRWKIASLVRALSVVLSIEATRICIELLAQKLVLCNPLYPLPDKGGANYDNCGENKVLPYLYNDKYFQR